LYIRNKTYNSSISNTAYNNQRRQDMIDWYDEEQCIEAVKIKGFNLQYVNFQTPKTVLEAV